MFLCAYTTLQTTTRLTRKVRRVFFGRLRVTLKRAFCGRVALKKTGCLQQMFKMMLLHLHACTQSCCPLINGHVDVALRNAAVTL